MTIIKKFFLSIALFSSSTLFCFEPISTTILVVGGLVQGYWVGKDIYQLKNPTPEQQLRTKTAEEKIKYVVDEHELQGLVIKKNVMLEKARINYKNCLLNSAGNARRDAYNSPINCKDILNDFIMCGGEADALIMIRNFDRINAR